MNLYYFFLKKFSRKNKLIFDNLTYTYQDFKKKVDLVAFFLNKFKDKKKILVITENSYHLGILLLAISKIGKIIIPLNKDLKEKQILDQISYISPEIIIYTKNFKNTVYKTKKSILINTEDIFKNIKITRI